MRAGPGSRSAKRRCAASTGAWRFTSRGEGDGRGQGIVLRDYAGGVTDAEAIVLLHRNSVFRAAAEDTGVK